MRSAGIPTRSHPLTATLVLAETELRIAGEDGRPELLGRKSHVLGHELPCEIDRSVLEVVANREVPEHLEERQVSGGEPDRVDIGRPEALLHASSVARPAAVSRPRKNGLSGCMPAVVSSTDGSWVAGTSEAEGRLRCPFDSKYARNPSRSSSVVRTDSIVGRRPRRVREPATEAPSRPALRCPPASPRHRPRRPVEPAAARPAAVAPPPLRQRRTSDRSA